MTEADASSAHAAAAAYNAGVAVDGYVSVIGPSWMLALEPHLRALSYPSKEWGADALQTSPLENGHSSATILIATAMLESMVSYRALQPKRSGARTRRCSRLSIAAWYRSAVRIIRFGSTGQPSMPPTNPADPGTRDYLLQVKALRALRPALREALYLRDIVTHNHLWRLDYQRDADTGVTTIAKPEWVGGLPTRLTRAVLNVKAQRTRPHGLRAVPTAVGRPETARVLLTVGEAVEALRADGWNLGWLREKYGGEVLDLPEIARRFARLVEATTRLEAP